MINKLRMIVGTDAWSGTTVNKFLGESHLPLMQQCGIKIIRIEFNADSVSNLRTLVPTAVNNGVEVLGVLLRLDLTDDIDAWGNWVYSTVNEFKTHVHTWEIWNEPNQDKFFPPVKDPVKYTQFLRRGYEQAKLADPTCFCLGGSVVFTNARALSFLTAIYQNGAKDFMDALSFHPYCDPYAPDDTSSPNPFVKLTDVRAIMANYGDTRPIWITEVGWETPPGDDAVSENEQADYLTRALAIAQDWGWVETFIIYKWIDTTSGIYKGLLHTDGSPKPSFYAVKTFTT